MNEVRVPGPYPVHPWQIRPCRQERPWYMAQLGIASRTVANIDHKEENSTNEQCRRQRLGQWRYESHLGGARCCGEARHWVAEGKSIRLPSLLNGYTSMTSYIFQTRVD